MKFSFLKIPVYIQPTFWLLILLCSGALDRISYTPIFIAIIIFISLLVHEYGHGLTARYFGASPKIELHMQGGSTHYNGAHLNEKQNFLITINGPLFESLLIVIPYLLLKFHIFQNMHINYFLYLTMRINFFWCLVNLVPIYPLDGGHICKYILKSKFGDSGIRASIIISITCAIIGASFFLINRDFIIGSIFALYGIQNFKMLTQNNFPFYKKNKFTRYNESQKAIEKNDLKKAKHILKNLIKTKSNISINVSSVESLAKIYYDENKKNRAYNLLISTDHSKLISGKCMLCKLAYEKQNFSLVAKYSRDIYEIEPSQEIAILNSKAFAGLNDIELSGGWIETASLFDSSKNELLRKILEDKIFDGIRENTSFKKHTKNIYFKEIHHS